jgi:hypothetical protein
MAADALSAVRADPMRKASGCVNISERQEQAVNQIRFTKRCALAQLRATLGKLDRNLASSNENGVGNARDAEYLLE